MDICEISEIYQTWESYSNLWILWKTDCYTIPNIFSVKRATYGGSIWINCKSPLGLMCAFTASCHSTFLSGVSKKAEDVVALSLATEPIKTCLVPAANPVPPSQCLTALTTAPTSPVLNCTSIKSFTTGRFIMPLCTSKPGTHKLTLLNEIQHRLLSICLMVR